MDSEAFKLFGIVVIVVTYFVFVTVLKIVKFCFAKIKELFENGSKKYSVSDKIQKSLTDNIYNGVIYDDKNIKTGGLKYFVIILAVAAAAVFYIGTEIKNTDFNVLKKSVADVMDKAVPYFKKSLTDSIKNYKSVNHNRKYDTNRSEVKYKDNSFEVKYKNNSSEEKYKNNSIKVNGLTDFNYKTKEEIYNIRKYFVSKSIFASENYKPSQAVFGAIESGKPWIGIESINFRWSKEHPNIGLSEESRFINNPSALVMVNMAYPNMIAAERFVKELYLLPASISYDRTSKYITVSYEHHIFHNSLVHEYRNGYLYILDGINAHDLDYAWVSVSDKNNIKFKLNRIEKEAVHFNTMLHTGMSAGIPGGATNGSPYQEELVFAIKELPAYIKLKLWRNRPDNVFSVQPDYYIDICFNDNQKVPK